MYPQRSRVALRLGPSRAAASILMTFSFTQKPYFEHRRRVRSAFFFHLSSLSQVESRASHKVDTPGMGICFCFATAFHGGVPILLHRAGPLDFLFRPRSIVRFCCGEGSGSTVIVIFFAKQISPRGLFLLAAHHRPSNRLLGFGWGGVLLDRRRDFCIAGWEEAGDLFLY